MLPVIWDQHEDYMQEKSAQSKQHIEELRRWGKQIWGAYLCLSVLHVQKQSLREYDFDNID